MSHKTKLSLLAVFLIALSLGSFWYFNQDILEPAPAQPLTPAVSLEQVNTKNDTTSSTEKVAEPDTKLALGTKPRGDIALSKDADFTVSGGSPTSSIRFFEGSIKPLDVHVGDTQDFRIVVASDNGIKRVVAEIETDFGYDYVELKKDSVISILDTIPNPYTVNPKDNTLKILNDTELAQARNNEYQKELARKNNNQANASLGQREVWVGSWLVNKVHDKVYHTNFIAYDSAGNQEKLTMTWSDLCAIPLSGSWNTASTTGCTIPTTKIDGVANGTTIIGRDPDTQVARNLALEVGSTFLWNTGKSISFAGGQLIVNTGGQMKQVPTIYVKDQDNDHYIAPGNLGTTQTSTVGLTGWHPRQNMIAETDCNDNNSNVMPDSAIYGKNPFTNIINPALSYDYDCNGVHEVNPIDRGYCSSSIDVTGAITGHRKRSCDGYDTGGCCSGGGGGGGCVGKDCGITKIRDLFFSKANAGEKKCCESYPAESIIGCQTVPLQRTASDCGLSKKVAFPSRFIYSTDYSSYGCTDTAKYNNNFYAEVTTIISCK